MVYEIILGRDETDRKKFEKKGLIYLGKHFVKMGETMSLSNKVYLDVARPHVILLSGKRGSGKSYSLGTIFEGVSVLEEDVRKNLSVLVVDTMGIFWTSRYPNKRQAKLLKKWGLEPKGSEVVVYVPYKYYNEGDFGDKPFSIRPVDLAGDDWASLFGIELLEPVGVLLERVIGQMTGNYSIDDIIKKIKADRKNPNNVKLALENRFLAAKEWGIFDVDGVELNDIIKGGQISILDVSCYKSFSSGVSLSAMVLSILGKKILDSRMNARRSEELEIIEETTELLEEQGKQEPLVWILIDEAHQFLPKKGETGASYTLTRLLREGRQPGISLVLATQQPGEISKDVMTQSDIVISHRVTAKKDVMALNSIMQTYLAKDILKYLNSLPDLEGSAIVLDDTNERIYPIRVRPRMSWHGGESPVAVKEDKKVLGVKI